MTGVQPSAQDNGIVENVLMVVLGIVLFGLGIVAARLRQGETIIVLFLCGIGLVVTLAGANSVRKAVQDLKQAGVTHPVAVLRADLNDRDKIIKDLVTLTLFWVGGGLLWAVFITTPAEASRMLGEIVRTSPELIAGWVLLNAFFIIGARFGTHRERTGPTSPL